MVVDEETELRKPWVAFPLEVSVGLEAFFSTVVITEVGYDTNTLFWQDRWLSE
jgi:hypothetical protein